MNLLITGSSGLVGSQLVKQLVTKNNIRIMLTEHVSKLTEFSSHPKVQIIPSQNIYDDFQHQEIHRFKPDMVIHLAGMSFIPDTESNQESTFYSNVFLSHKLLDVLEPIKPKYFLFASTAGLYPSSKKIHGENSEVLPNSTYLHTKYLCENRIRYSLKDTKKIVLRFSNIYGENSRKPFLLTKIYQSIIHNHLPISFGNIYAVRDYIYVQDVTNAIQEIIDAPKKIVDSYSIFNVSSGTSLSVKEIINLSWKYFGEYSYIVDNSLLRKNDKKYLFISSEKFRTVFSWKPLFNIQHYFETIGYLEMGKQH